MILGEVQPRRRFGAKRLAEGQAKAGRFHHEAVDVEIQCFHHRYVGVAARHGRATRRSEDRRRQRSGGGLAVGTGDGDDRAGTTGTRALPLVGQIEFGDDPPADPSGGGDHRMGLRNTRRRCHHRRTSHQIADGRFGRPLDQFDAESIEFGPSCRIYGVVGGDHVDIASDQSSNSGHSRDSDSVDQYSLGHRNRLPA